MFVKLVLSSICRSARCLKILYFAFVHPHLLHGIELYANTSSVHLSKIITLNNKILRILQNQPYNSSVKDLYAEYNTLPIPQLHIQQLLILVHKFVYHRHLLPSIFLNYFQDNKSIYSYDTRNKANLHLHSVNTTYGQRSVKYEAASLWNDLPQSVKDVVSINKFKQSVKLFLLNQI